MILATPAIALRVSPFSRTSRMVTWLTPAYGRLVTSIKGACRPKSAFLGQFDLASRCELLFYRRERDGVHVARECAPLAWRPHLRADWRAAVAAGYLCELTGRVAQPLLDSQALFALLDETLELLGAGSARPDGGCAGAPLEARVLRFELKLLEILGLGPRFEACPGCAIEERARHCRFALMAGRLDCLHAPGRRQYEGPSVALTAEMLDALRRWRAHPAAAEEPWQVAGAAGCHEATEEWNGGGGQNLAIGMRRLLGMLLQCHLDLPLDSRQALFAWLDESPAAM